MPNALRRAARWGALFAGLCLAPFAWGQSPPSAPVPLQAFTQPSALSAASLSPSGRYVAAAVRRPGERRKLVVMDMQSDAPPRVVAAIDRFDVQNPRWVDEDSLVFSVSDDEAHGSLENRGGLFSVSREGKQFKRLIKLTWDQDFPEHTGALEGNHIYLGMGRPGSGEVLVGELIFDAVGEVERISPMALHVRTRVRRSLAVDLPHRRITAWEFDMQGRPRLAGAVEGNQRLWFFADREGKWREIARFPMLEAAFSPSFVDEQDRVYVEARRDGDLLRLYRLNLETGALEPEPVPDTPGFDLALSPIQLPDGRVAGYSTWTDKRETRWLLPAMQALQEKIDEMLPGRVNALQCVNCEQAESVLVHSYSDRFPGEYFHFNRKRGEWASLGQVAPGLDENRMGRTTLERVSARDGLSIPTWFTVPIGLEAKKLPAVVLVHGGPWARGRYWGYEPDAQFLASRGYLVIEPEFRGSTGFGDRHFRASWKQWGLAMQDDLVDALKFAIDKGWVDAKRVCIAGASYGGYAALMGLVKQSDWFQCAVSWIGVTDLDLLYTAHWSDASATARRYGMPVMLGDRVRDRALLDANSPVKQAAAIRKPVLLAYGRLDRRVPVDHGQAMRKALTAAGNPPEYVEYEGEGHGWHKQATQLDFWGRVERFLQRHLGP